MYITVLAIHSMVRWVVLATGLIAVVRAITGWRSGRPWTLTDERSGMWFLSALDLQMLLGLALYFFLSPITHAALRDFGSVMGNSGLRYWTIEHAFGMLLGVTLAHIGRSRTRKIPHDARRHRIAAIFFTLALLSIAASIPWPGSPQGRPLIRWQSTK
jgi:hypothetical protein